MILSTNIQTSVAYYWENVQGTSCARQLKHGWPDLKWHFAFFRRQRSLGSIVLARFGIHYNIFIVRYKKDKEPTLPSSRYSGPFLFCTRFTRLNLCMSVQGTHARNAKPEEDCGVKKKLAGNIFRSASRVLQARPHPPSAAFPRDYQSRLWSIHHFGFSDGAHILELCIRCFIFIFKLNNRDRDIVSIMARWLSR